MQNQSPAQTNPLQSSYQSTATKWWFPSIAALLALCSTSALVARDSPWQDETVVVTANRTDQPAGRVPASVSVITRQDIERSGAADLLELLRLEAGIDITRTGGAGGQTSVFIRGSNSNHVLVLIDGVRAAASGTGAFTWEILDPAVIERVEIVRGPRAARWGSDAIGGVIQIFTRRPEGAQAGLRYGSDDDRRLSAAFGGGSDRLSADLTISARSVDGFSAQNPAGFAYDPDDDGFENLSAATGGRAALAGGALKWRGRIATGETEFDQGITDFENWSWRFDYERDRQGPWQWQVGLATLRDRLETETAFGSAEVVTRRLQADALVQRQLGDSTNWLIGLDAWRESGLSASQWDESRTNVGLFTGLEGRADALGWELSVRIDDDDSFGTEVTGNAALDWRFAPNWRAFATAGRAFRAPTFSQLYSPGFAGLFAGNPDLDAERSWSTELGIDFRPSAAQRLTLAVYNNEIDDLIGFSGVDFQAVNVNEARIRGLEATHTLRLPDWGSELQLTWQDPRDLDADRDLLRRPGFKGSWALDWQPDPRWQIGGELVHVGDRLDVGAAELASYTLVNLRAGYLWSERWRLDLRVDNLADRSYEPLVGFNAADRRVFIELGWRARGAIN